MNKSYIIYGIIFFLTISLAQAQVTERKRPEGWDKLVFGGRFMDRFLPMPNLGGMTKDTWGAPNVIPRDTANGIEHKDWSYWGGNIRQMDDGKYHLFVCRWPENAEHGHFEWGNSDVVHAISENSFGPFKAVKEIGKGHNPEWYITNSGKYVIYVINGYYLSDKVDGSWKYKKFEFDSCDRKIIEGLSNLTFAKREDGSFLMICRGGGVWISKDGLSTWNQISNSRVYPPVDGRFEDPLIWKTNVQYHLIVNDWLGRIAWYMRSKDGINWKMDPGEAYLPGIAKHKDGTVEGWFKFERIKVLQDKYGRATQANFAVIDTLKYMDKKDDNHNSKLITIPLTVGKLMSVLNKKPISSDTKKIKVLIKAEKGFNPNTDMEIASLRFGAPEKVNFGQGCKVKSIKKAGNDAILTFEGESNGITSDNFAAKLLGKDKKGNLLFAYSKLPGVNYIEATLSARKPVYDSLQNKLTVDVENFGQITPKATILYIEILKDREKTEVATISIPPLRPYERKTFEICTKKDILCIKNANYLVYTINPKNKEKQILFHSAIKQ